MAARSERFKGGKDEAFLAIFEKLPKTEVQFGKINKIFINF